MKKHAIWGLRLVCLVLFSLVMSGGGGVADTPQNLCKRAAQRAAAQSNVPFDVLWAISLTETGTKRNGVFDVWPWTVNMEGKGHWFDSRDEALAYALQEQAAGARSFDIGCFQLNHRWHGKGFASVDAMFDPDQSARYAANFLSQLYAETGSWERAAGYYHSRSPALAQKYQALFRQHLANARARIARGDLPPAEPNAAPRRLAAAQGNGRVRRVTARQNDYPLLRRGHAGALGSLVPLALFETAGGAHDAGL